MPKSRGRKPKTNKQSGLAQSRQRELLPQSNRGEQINREIWFRVGRWSIGVVSFALGVIASVAGIWGVPWPTDPVFSAEPPSSASPFDNPFDVSNKSGFIDIHDLYIHCEVYSAKTKRLTVTKDFRGKLLFPSKGPNPILHAGKSSAFTCPFRDAMDKIGFGASALDDPTEALIGLVWTYNTPWWWHGFWLNPHRGNTDVFSLNTKTAPPRWVPGVPLQ